MAGEIHEDPVLEYRYRFQPAGDVLKVDVWIDPGGGVTIEHYHPNIEERWHVLEGEVTFKLDGEERLAKAGDRLTAPPGARHALQNTGQTEARLEVDAEPPGRLQEFLTEAARLAQAGRYNKRGMPRGLRGLLEGADFSLRYRDTSVTTFPPPAVQRVLFPPVAWLHRRLA